MKAEADAPGPAKYVTRLSHGRAGHPKTPYIKL